MNDSKLASDLRQQRVDERRVRVTQLAQELRVELTELVKLDPEMAIGMGFGLSGALYEFAEDAEKRLRRFRASLKKH